MTKEKESTVFKFGKQGMAIHIPADVRKDSLNPLTVGMKVNVEVDGEKMVITPFGVVPDKEISYSWVDEGLVGITCSCGAELAIGNDPDDTNKCDKCGKDYKLQQTISVIEVKQGVGMCKYLSYVEASVCVPMVMVCDGGSFDCPKTQDKLKATSDCWKVE